jgi:hypothetical protein
VCTVAFRESLSVVAIDKREMPPSRVRKPKKPGKQLLSRGTREEIVAADDVGDSMSRIIDDDRELIRRHAEFRPNDEVTRFKTRVERALTEEFIEDVFIAGFDAEAMIRFPRLNHARPRLWWPQLGRVTRFAVLCVRRTRCRPNLTSRAIAAKELARLGKPREHRAIGHEVARLHFDFAIPIEPQIREVGDCRRVGAVLDAPDI